MRRNSILGTAAADTVDADAGDDTIDGAGGDDSLTGGLGSDLIIGGDGVDTVYANTVYWTGKWEDYLVAAVPGGFVLADKLGAGTSNEVRGVEFFAFADGTFAADALPNLVDAPVITVIADRPSQVEGTGGATALTFTVALDRPAEASLSVVVEATQQSSYDYDPDRTVFPGDLAGGSYPWYPSERLVFAPGEVSKTFTVQLAGDSEIENDERLTVYLHDPLGSQVVLGRQSVATMTVLDDDTAGVGVSAVDARTAEGQAGTAAFSFQVHLDAPVPTAQTVRYEVAGDGDHPASASDFAGGALPSGTVTFLPGETSKTVTVDVASDAADEFDEGFRVSLSSPSAKLAPGRDSAATATVLDDDTPVTRGTAWDDVLPREAGHRVYEGLGGHDALDAGGLGYRGAQVAAQADGGVLLEHGDDRAVLRGVEEVRFADGRLVFDGADPAAQVVRLYEAALDRLPDQGGLNFWIDAVQHGGQALSALASGFLASAEFQARFGGAASDGAFVDRLYLNVLGRDGEAAGRQFWVDSLGHGAGRAGVLAGFSESAENKAGTAALAQAGIWDRSEAAAEVARLYDAVLGRLPDAPGLVGWKGMLEGGQLSLSQMAGAFIASAEFQSKYGGLDDRGFADVLYRNTLDRAADQAGLDHWTGALAAGAKRADVVLAFSESAEHVALTAADIQSENTQQFGIAFA